MAIWDVTTAGDRLAYTSGGKYPSCWKIDTNHFLVTVQGSSDDGFCQICEVNTSTWAVTTASEFEFFTADCEDNSVCQIDANHFINFFKAGADDDGQAQVLTVNTSTWAVTTASDIFEFDTNNATWDSCCKVDTNHFINFWQGSSDDGFCQIFEVNTSTWAVTTAGALKEWYTSDVIRNRCAKIDDTHVLNLFTGGGVNACYGQVLAINTSTWAVTTAAAAVQIRNTNEYYPVCNREPENLFVLGPTDNHVFIRWQDSDGSLNKYQVLAINTSTWVITTSAIQYSDSDTGDGEGELCRIDTNHFINFYSGSLGDGYARVCEVNTSTWAITTVGSYVEFDGDSLVDCSAWKVDTNHFIIFWQNQNQAEGRVQILEVEYAAGGPSSLKTYDSVAAANLKTLNGIAIASLKTYDSIA